MTPKEHATRLFSRNLIAVGFFPCSFCLWLSVDRSRWISGPPQSFFVRRIFVIRGLGGIFFSSFFQPFSTIGKMWENSGRTLPPYGCDRLTRELLTAFVFFMATRSERLVFAFPTQTFLPSFLFFSSTRHCNLGSNCDRLLFPYPFFV